MSQVEALQLTLDQAKELVSRRDMALKLENSRAYKTLILDGYCKDEAVRLVRLSADHSVAQHAEEIQLAIKSISMFQQFMQNIIRVGDIAERELENYEEELELARKEEAYELEFVS